MLGNSGKIYKFLSEIMQYQECPGTAPNYLVDQIIKMINPEAGYFVSRAQGKLSFNGLVMIGGQGILLKVSDANGRRIALKIAKPSGPVNLNRSIFRDGKELDLQDIQSIPDMRFLESAKLQDAVENAMTKESVKFVVPRIYTISEKPMPFIAMEWIESEDILVVIRDKNNLRYSLERFFNVLEAVDFLHHHNIVFRDIKSKNLKICGDDRIVLLDFGLAKIMENRNVTISGTPIGTWPYASPKLMDGFGDQATPPDDVHGLGYTLFEFVVREECPEYAVDPRDTRAREDYRIRLKDLLPLPLQRIFMKSTEAWEKLRYQSVKDLLVDLQAVYYEINNKEITHKNSDRELTVLEPLTPQPPKRHGFTNRFTPAQFDEEQENEAEYFIKAIVKNEKAIMDSPCSKCQLPECKENDCQICKKMMISNLQMFRKIFLE